MQSVKQRLKLKSESESRRTASNSSRSGREAKVRRGGAVEGRKKGGGTWAGPARRASSALTLLEGPQGATCTPRWTSPCATALLPTLDSSSSPHQHVYTFPARRASSALTLLEGPASVIADLFRRANSMMLARYLHASLDQPMCHRPSSDPRQLLLSSPARVHLYSAGEERRSCRGSEEGRWHMGWSSEACK
jgi:hypothetical protein